MAETLETLVEKLKKAKEAKKAAEMTQQNILKYTLKDIFALLHDEANKRFYGQLVLMSTPDEGYPGALSDPEVRYGTDNYELFEQSVREDFTEKEAEQILSYVIQIVERDDYFMALDTAISYIEDNESAEKKMLYVTAYPKHEYEQTKACKMRREQGPHIHFRF